MKTSRLLLLTSPVLALLVVLTMASDEIATDSNAESQVTQQTSGQNIGERVEADDAALIVPDIEQMETSDEWLAVSPVDMDDNPSATVAQKEWARPGASASPAGQNDRVMLGAQSVAQAERLPAGPSELVTQADSFNAGSYQFRLLAGQQGSKGYMDGVGAAARFTNPGGIAVDAVGNVYVSERNLCVIRKITPDGVVTTWAGTAGEKDSKDGVGAAARFNSPSHLAVDGADNVFVAEANAIRKITPAGVVSTIANFSGCIAADEPGNVFVLAGSIRKITPAGTVFTFPTTITPYESVAGFHNFTDAWALELRVDHVGNLFAIYTDFWDFSDVVKFVPNSAGGYTGSALMPDPKIISHPWHSDGWAEGIGVDGAGNLLITYDQNPVAVYMPNGEFRFRSIATDPDAIVGGALAVSRKGDLYALPGSNWDIFGGTVMIGSFDPAAVGPVILQQPFDKSAERGKGIQFTVLADGVPPLAYQWYYNGNLIPGATTSSLALNNVQDGNAGSYSVVVTDSTGSVASRNARLSVVAPSTQPPPPVTPVPSIPTGTTSNSPGGGGAVSPAFLLALILLVTAAEIRRRRRGLSCV